MSFAAQRLKAAKFTPFTAPTIALVRNLGVGAWAALSPQASPSDPTMGAASSVGNLILGILFISGNDLASLTGHSITPYNYVGGSIPLLASLRAGLGSAGTAFGIGGKVTTSTADICTPVAVSSTGLNGYACGFAEFSASGGSAGGFASAPQEVIALDDNAGTSGSFSLTFHPQYVGELMVVMSICFGTYTIPSGWTQIGPGGRFDNCCYRLATSGDVGAGSVTATYTGATNIVEAVGVRWH